MVAAGADCRSESRWAYSCPMYGPGEEKSYSMMASTSPEATVSPATTRS